MSPPNQPYQPPTASLVFDDPAGVGLAAVRMIRLRAQGRVRIRFLLQFRSYCDSLQHN